MLPLLALAGTLWSSPEAAGHPWLFVSDVHYAPYDKRRRPSFYDGDTNGPLLASFLAAAKAADPDPPVVVIAGDFLGHHMHLSDDSATMVELAHRFDRTFPNAQFVMTLGNDDSPCGDYTAPAGGAYLATVAKAWAPLVNRHGAAPDFLRTFSRDGSYTSRLPVQGLRAVVIDDVFFTLRYASRCATPDASGRAIGELGTMLRGDAGNRAWVILHVPPGVDAYSTAHLVHRLFVVPFMRTGSREALLDVLSDPASHVGLVVGGHTHKFAYRLLSSPGRQAVPMLLIPSVSPIFQNDPAFLLAPVSATGAIGNIVEYAYDGSTWRRYGSLRELGATAFTVKALRGVQARIAADPAVRDRFSQLYSAGGEQEINARNWRVYWCAATALNDTAFSGCVGGGGIAFLRPRALAIAAVVVVLILLLAALSVRAVQKRRPHIDRPH